MPGGLLLGAAARVVRAAAMLVLALGVVAVFCAVFAIVYDGWANGYCSGMPDAGPCDSGRIDSQSVAITIPLAGGTALGAFMFLGSNPEPWGFYRERGG